MIAPRAGADAKRLQARHGKVAAAITTLEGMLILYGVARDDALAAVLLHQAIGLLVPLIGGGVAYTILRRRLGPIRPGAAKDPVDPGLST